MRPIKKGSMDQSVVIRIIDSTDGTPETGVDYDTSGIDLWYRREKETKVSITEAALAALDSAHSDGGIEHIGDGYYRLDLPDAAVGAGSGENGVMVGGTLTGMIVIGCYVPLVDYDPYDANMGLTNLDAAISSRSSHTAAQAGTDAASKVLATPAQKLATDANGKVTVENVDDCKADVSGLATSAALTTHDDKLDTVDTVADAIKAKTDNLPADPASETNVDANETKIDTIDTVVDAIKAKTDNLPADPASETNVDANETKIDTLDTVADAIKAVTDKLDDTLEDDAGTYRFTENALEEAPSGTGASAAAIADAVWDETKTDHTGDLKTVADRLDVTVSSRSAESGGNVAAIKAKTDNLPADPASETNVNANETKIDTLDTVADAIKAKTDNLPADPASETNVNANETKIDTLDTVADAIKAVTDKLDDTLEDDSGTYRFTENALEQAPSGTGGDATAANQTTIITHLTDVKGNEFAGETDALKPIRDKIDTISGGTPVNIEHESTVISKDSG